MRARQGKAWLARLETYARSLARAGKLCAKAGTVNTFGRLAVNQCPPGEVCSPTFWAHSVWIVPGLSTSAPGLDRLLVEEAQPALPVTSALLAALGSAEAPLVLRQDVRRYSPHLRRDSLQIGSDRAHICAGTGHRYICSAPPYSTCITRCGGCMRAQCSTSHCNAICEQDCQQCVVPAQTSGSRGRCEKCAFQVPRRCAAWHGLLPEHNRAHR